MRTLNFSEIDQVCTYDAWSDHVTEEIVTALQDKTDAWTTGWCRDHNRDMCWSVTHYTRKVDPVLMDEVVSERHIEHLDEYSKLDGLLSNGNGSTHFSNGLCIEVEVGPDEFKTTGDCVRVINHTTDITTIQRVLGECLEEAGVHQNECCTHELWIVSRMVPEQVDLYLSPKDSDGFGGEAPEKPRNDDYEKWGWQGKISNGGKCLNDIHEQCSPEIVKKFEDFIMLSHDMPADVPLSLTVAGYTLTKR